MLDPGALKLVAALVDTSLRAEAAAALAAQFGAEALLIFVEDVDVDALLPAPGFPSTVPGGPGWRKLLDECRRPGVHRGAVAYPTADRISPAQACAGSGVALVFAGGECDSAQVKAISLLLPLLGGNLRAEHQVNAALGEIAAAREDARHAGALARSLDVARADLERQAKSLAAAQGLAEVAMRAKDEFLAMLGHELRNPLAPIMTALQIMRMRGDTSREQEVLDRQVGNLMRLVDDLLDVSRIASGKVELRKERLELGTVAARAVELASPLLERNHQVLTVDIAERGMPLDGDPVRLAQIFSNLLTNAAKFSHAGSPIAFSAKRVSDKIFVRVKDEGFGIEPSMLDAIFDRFVQQQQSPDRAQGGLGLGLAIVKNLVSLHGGTVKASSEGRGRGSEFVVELPISTASAVAQAPAQSCARARAGVFEKRDVKDVARVLVVDDNEDAAELLSAALLRLGYVVRTASDGPSALLVAREFRPQIALLDIGLPVMDGYELGRRLREERGDAVLHLVALTGYGQASDKARSRDGGFEEHLVKPVELINLQQILERLYPTQTAT